MSCVPNECFSGSASSRARRSAKSPIVAQRLKRFPSIISKLERFRTMTLTQMQDIGGLRAVIDSMTGLRKIHELYKGQDSPHKLFKTNDYIATPKPMNGYRSLHLIYRYINEDDPRYNDMHLEIQLRTVLQHAWGTAVETIDTLFGQKLKASLGDKSWTDFFRAASAAFSHLEEEAVVQEYSGLTRKQLFKLVAEMEAELQVLHKLGTLSNAIESITYVGSKAKYYLLILDAKFRSVTIQSFAERNYMQALSQYVQAESRARKGDQIEAVLVTGPAIANLKKAYPNYYLDTTKFSSTIQKIIKESV
ncbi:MAG: RelA/SpoT domain-containing protein [Gemmatales bacterium]